MTRIRKSVYHLAPNDQTLLWYGRAIEAMRARPDSDPKSWTYQARIHALQGDPPAAQNRFWKKCQHRTSYFLPWHRMYLLHFERIVASEVTRLGGPANWALPYWNYSERRDSPSDPDFRAIPPAFRSPTLPGGGTNHLYVAQRGPGVNNGDPLANQWLQLRQSLAGAPDTSLTGFFGQPQANHNSLGDPGTLEQNIHNGVHVGVGGQQNPPGWMSHPITAGFDPIFWLHHCNIDRLWAVWLRRPGNRNLTTAYWLTGVTFYFNDASGNQVGMRTRDVIDLAAPALDYGYDDLTDPFPPPVSPGGFVDTQVTMPPIELVGATTAPITLGKAVETIDVPTPVSPQAFRVAAGGFVAPDAKTSDLVEQVTLQLEGVRSSAPAPVYDLYVNVPDADPSAHDDRYVGRATFFGIDEASDPAGPHGGGGQNMAFDITELYHRLAETGEIAPDNLRVSFVPVEPDDNQVVVSRVNLYFG